MRWIIEGTWSGYRSGQSRVCHREVTSNRKFAEGIKNLGWITFADGTSLSLSVREAAPRERVQPLKTYYNLIRDCHYKGVNSVQALIALQKAQQQKVPVQNLEETA